jgi:ABC-type uncharacterized transport system substrate-binding protein
MLSPAIFSILVKFFHLLQNIVAHPHTYMTPIAEALKKEEHLSDKKDYWENELKSLGIEPRRQNELNDKEEELQALAESIKAVYYQDYKTAYSSSSSTCKGNDDKEEGGEEGIIDKSHFDHII